MAVRISVLTLGLVLVTLGVVTMADTFFALRWAISQGFVENSSPVSIPASVGFIVTGMTFVLLAASDAVWNGERNL